MRLRFAATTTGFVALMAATGASAQSVPANVGVADRTRSEYDPVGARLGSFILLPRVETSVAYDDNIYAARADKVSDEILTITPAARLSSQWQRNRLDINALYSRNFYASRGSESNSNYQVDAAGILDVSRQTQVRLQALAGRFIESRTDINSFSAIASPTRFTRVSGRAGLDHQFNTLAVSAEAGVQKLSYSDTRLIDNTVFDQSFRDNVLTDGTLRLRYGLRTGTAFVVQVSADKLHYNNAPPPVLGAVANRDTSGYRVEGGLILELSSLIYGDVRIGYLHRNTADPTIKNVSGLSFAANVLWNVTPLTSVRLIANRSVEDSVSRIVAGNLRSQGTLTVDHELLRNVLLNASVRYANISPIGPVSDSQELEFRAGATYYLNRRFGLRASYRLYDRSSKVFQEFTSNRLTATLITRF